MVGGADFVDTCHSGASGTAWWHVLLSLPSAPCTDVLFLTNTVVLSPVAARKAVNFKNKSRSGSGVVITGADRPPASIRSTEQGFGFLPLLGKVFCPRGEAFLRQRGDSPVSFRALWSGLCTSPCVCEYPRLRDPIRRSPSQAQNL